MEPKIICKKCKREFEKRTLKCPNCDQIGVEALYKYIPFNKHSLSILINKTIWCPKAKSFNDPFEFYFYLNDNSIDKNSIQKTIDSTKEMAVICFSEINDDLLMWAHYAQGHTGFCIEFERNENNNLGEWDKCVPVNYNKDKQVPIFSLDQITSSNIFTKIATSKSLAWEYEKEWRLIINHNYANKLISLPAPITAIIFGCNMSGTNRKTIANILGPEFKYKEAIKNNKEFSLNIFPVKFEDLTKG